MRKTVALFALALSLILAAVIFGFRTVPRPAPTPPPPPISELPISTPTPTPGGSTLSMGDLVRLDGSLSNSFVQAGSPSSLFLLIDLIGKETSGARPPMAVALVIDRSGSMAGDKIQQARLAAKQFASRLGDDDQLAIVTYSSDYAVDLPLTTLKGQRDRIERVVDDILDGGGTDIGGGLQAGVLALRRAAPNAVKRLVLISDGNANQGITDPNALVAIARQSRQDDITVSTLGVGLDFNEDLLTLMAQSAGGGYEYARDGEAISKALDKEFAGLSKIAARGVEVGLDLAPGFTIREVFGYRTELRRGRVVIPVGDIASGERRRVMVQLSGAPVADARPVDVARLVLAYSAASSEDAREHQGDLSVVATASAGELTSGERREVEEAYQSALAAEAREKAAFSFQSGDKVQAMERLRTQIDTTKRRNAELKSAFLNSQVLEMEDALRGISTSAVESDEGKDLVKQEKLRARQVFAY